MLAWRSEQHGQDLIEKLKKAKPFEIIFIKVSCSIINAVRIVMRNY